MHKDVQKWGDMLKRKKETFKFSIKKHSIMGIISSILGSISCITLIVLSYISSRTAGNGGLVLGVIGMALFCLSITGIVLAIKGFKEKEIYYTAPIVGLGLNGFLSIVYFVLYMVGISI